MKNTKDWLFHYVFFKEEVSEKCPKCGAEKLMHYSWNDLGDDSGHFRACMEDDCNFDENISYILAHPCNSCSFQGDDTPTGSFELKLKCPAKTTISLGE